VSGSRLDTLGLIRSGGDSVRVGDDVRVELVLSQPAYAYLLALNTNGSVQLCLPVSDAEQPLRTDRLELYPSQVETFRLTEGPGVQGFVAVASRRPLPAYRDWGLDPATLRWTHVEAAGIWRYDGEQFTLDRPFGPWNGGTVKRGERIRLVPEPFERACKSLGDRPGVEAVGAVAFPVRASPAQASGPGDLKSGVIP
jgi:hypothetical protein